MPPAGALKRDAAWGKQHLFAGAPPQWL